MRSPFKLMVQRLYVWHAHQRPSATIPAALQVVPVNTVNVSRVTEFRSDVQRKLFESFVAEGANGVYAVENDRVIGHAWATAPAKTRGLVNGYFRADHGDVLIHFCAVSPESRGKGVYGAMLRALVNMSLTDDSTCRIFIDSDEANAASLRAIEREGFDFVGSALYWRFLRWTLFRHQPNSAE
jgi:RimJ/RimL family protein N-acetyltransferase